MLYARTTCDDTGTQIVCEDANDNGAEVISFPVVSGTTYYVFVDGYDGKNGPYKINVTVTPHGCGDGIVDAGEECDDGNAIETDGCDHLCKWVSSGPGDLCPGAELALTTSGLITTGSASGSTAALGANYAGTCATSGAPEGKEAVYHFNSGPGGDAVVNFGSADFDTVLYVRSGACEPGTEVDCADLIGDGSE